MAGTPDPGTIDLTLLFGPPSPDPPSPESASPESPDPDPPGSISAALRARRLQAVATVRKPRRKPNKVRAPIYKPSGGRKPPATSKRNSKGKCKGPTLGKVRGEVVKPQ
jgi:hypothetical protein